MLSRPPDDTAADVNGLLSARSTGTVTPELARRPEPTTGRSMHESHDTTSHRRRCLVCIPCLLSGGTEMQTLALVRVLAGEGYAVAVLCYHEWDDGVVAGFRDTGAVVRLLDWPRSVSAWTFVAMLRRVIRDAAPGLVHVQYMAPGALPILAARLAGVPRILATVHQPWTPDAHGWRAKWFLRTAARLCDRFVCVSEAAERSWFGTSRVLDQNDPSTLASHHSTIHNTVDTERIDAIISETDRTAVRHDLGLAPLDPVVGVVSRLREEKGIDVLVDAFASVHGRVPQARLLVVGDGPDRGALQLQAAKLGIGDSVIWAGARPWPEAIRLMSAMDVVAVPSRFEGFGLSAIEAMACGKPVVASAVGGLPEIVENSETGLLVPPVDPQVLGQALLRLMEDPGLRQRLGTNAAADARRRFGLPVFGRRVLAHYEAVGFGCAPGHGPGTQRQ